ncbi:MAG: helix-turn-helix domain-containing protein [Oscillospiraceae bacterium]|nr:helix-turn-helix domain-containing protein [Oscillospiraceae bacterium]
MYDFGLRLRELRERKKLSQTQVAKRLNLSNTTICCYEANIRYPSFDMLTQLALFYNVSSDYLLGIENRSMVNVDGLTERQLDLVTSLISEFRSGKTKGQKI